MATEEKIQENKKSGKIIKVAEGQELRKVEEDVLIPRIMKKRAMERCSHYVQEFENCVRGRYISVLWACQEQNKKMQDCMTTLYLDEEFKKECRQEYLTQRENYRKTGIRNKETKATSS